MKFYEKPELELYFFDSEALMDTSGFLATEDHENGEDNDGGYDWYE